MTAIVAPKRILLAKTTHLGDLIISLPMAAALKQHFPGCEIIFLTHSRTIEAAKRCLDVDEVYGLPGRHVEVVELLKTLNIDVFIQINTSEDLAISAQMAGIPVRIGSSFRWYNWRWCTHRVAISRGFRQLNKRLLDMEYLRPLGIRTFSLNEMPDLYRFAKSESSAFLADLGISENKRRIILHPALITSKAHQWPLSYYEALMQSFSRNEYQWIITGTEADKHYLEPLLVKDDAVDKMDTVGKLSLDQLISLMQASDGLVAGSTGPLHMAAALGINTLGFYQSDVAVFKRWAAVGKSVTLLQGKTACIGDKAERICPCVESIGTEQVKSVIAGWFNR